VDLNIGRKSALIVVDVQRDFCPGGTLAVSEGDEIIEPINNLIKAFTKNGLPVIFTRDWHPKNHSSFNEYGGLWPPHCIQNTPGAEFHPKLNVPKDAITISKATESNKDAYSGFEGTELANILRKLNVKNVFVSGLATDYCVKNTVIDALKNHFTTHIIIDCIRGVNLKLTDSDKAIRKMVSLGAKKISCERLAMSIRRVAVLSSS
jgi:nicotinamidase/pyrazinamidase